MSIVLQGEAGELRLSDTEWLSITVLLGLFVPDRRGWGYFRGKSRLDAHEAGVFADDVEAAAERLREHPGHGVDILHDLPDVRPVAAFCRQGAFTVRQTADR